MQKAPIFGIIWMVFILLTCSLALAGCGYKAEEQAYAAAATPLLQNCGNIALNPAGKLLDAQNAQHKGTCILQAYQHCQTATLTFSRSGIDTISMQTFSLIKKQRQCKVTDLVQFRVVPAPLKTQGLYTCAGVSEMNDTLLIKNCGSQGTITIPLVTG